MNRYFIILSFKGTSYHGWQIQPNAITVQEILNNKLGMLLREKTETTGAGRTDTGVHASFYVAHFDTMHDNLENNEPFLFRINQVLPADIAVHGFKKMHPLAHARYDATDRTYVYRIIHEKNPFIQEFTWHITHRPDTNLMNQACALLSQYTDFRSFAKQHSDVKTYDCKVIHASWQYCENTLIFTITANRFLRDMVRCLASTLLDVGFGKITIDRFAEIIESKNRQHASESAPAQGLTLNMINYPPEYQIAALFSRQLQINKLW